MSDAKGPYKTEEFKEAWTVRGPGGNTPLPTRKMPMFTEAS